MPKTMGPALFLRHQLAAVDLSLSPSKATQTGLTTSTVPVPPQIEQPSLADLAGVLPAGRSGSSSHRPCESQVAGCGTNSGLI